MPASRFSNYARGRHVELLDVGGGVDVSPSVSHVTASVMSDTLFFSRCNTRHFEQICPGFCVVVCKRKPGPRKLHK